MADLIKYTAPVEQAVELGWDSRNGHSIIRRWRAAETDARAHYEALIASGLYRSVSLRGRGDVWDIEARADAQPETGGNTPDPESAEPVNTWELTFNRVEKDMLYADINAVRLLDAADLQLLRDFADGRKSFEDYRTSSPAFVAPGSGDPVGLYGLLQRGVRSVTVYQAVVRWTVAVPSGYTLSDATAGVGRVWTKAQVTSLGTPASVSNNMPASGGSGAYLYGYLKGGPSISATADGRTSLTIEWEYGAWTPVLYSAY